MLPLFVRPARVLLRAVHFVLALFAVTVAPTAPSKTAQHGILSGFDRDAYEFLLGTDRIRSVVWSVRALLGPWMVRQTVSP